MNNDPKNAKVDTFKLLSNIQKNSHSSQSVLSQKKKPTKGTVISKSVNKENNMITTLHENGSLVGHENFSYIDNPKKNK